MTQDTPWRPLGVDTDEEIEQYEALHEGLTPWLADTFWRWLCLAFRDDYGSVDEGRLWQMRRILRIGADPLPGLGLLRTLQTMGADPFVMADFVLARDYAPGDVLEQLLRESNSTWTVGTRGDFPGLVRRVPEGVQLAVDETIACPGRAGKLLATAWGHAYGVDGKPDVAYREAVRAVEDVVIPHVCPTDGRATLGKAISVFRNQGAQWMLPPTKRGAQDPRLTLLAMMQTLWEGDPRHGGQADQPVHPTREDAIMAVSLSVSIINIWNSGLVSKAP